MSERIVVVYYNDDFSHQEDKPLDLVLSWLADGEAELARMPRPTRKQPDRTRLVYRYKGPRKAAWAEALECRGLSARMPAVVTELAAEGVGAFTAFADAWHGQTTPAFRALRSLPAGIKLLVNPMTAPA